MYTVIAAVTNGDGTDIKNHYKLVYVNIHN